MAGGAVSRLAVTALRLAQFRSHGATGLALDGQPVVLHGANGAGKTNLLEAVSMLAPGRGLRRAAAAEIATVEAGIGWRVRATVATPDGPSEIVTGAGAGETARRVEIDGKATTQATLGRLVRMLWLVPAMDRLWIEGAAERRRFLDRMTLSLRPQHGEAAIAYERAMRERNRLLKDQVRDPRWYGSLEAQMARAGATLHANRVATLAAVAAAEDAGSAFPRADLALESAEDDRAPREADALAAALAEGRRRDLAAGRTLTGPHRDDLRAVWAEKGIEARLASTGEQKALLVSVALANARALAAATGAPPILLLDEVAAHLDPRRRAALYEEIVALGAQAWLTGTEATLFEALGARAAWFEEREADGGSTVVPSAGTRG